MMISEEEVKAAERTIKEYCEWRQSCVCFPHWDNCHRNPPKCWDVSSDKLGGAHNEH